MMLMVLMAIVVIILITTTTTVTIIIIMTTTEASVARSGVRNIMNHLSNNKTMSKMRDYAHKNSTLVKTSARELRSCNLSNRRVEGDEVIVLGAMTTMAGVAFNIIINYQRQSESRREH